MDMKSAAGGASLTVLWCVLLLSACDRASSRSQVVDADRVQRGEYLVSVAACGDCHTPMKMGAAGPEPDFSRLLAGHPSSEVVTAPPSLQGPWVWAGTGTNTAFAGPWGITYAFNLTPDENTGMGIWTEQMFVDAMKLGKHFGQARPIQPPMPWQSYSKFTDEDLRAIFAYLRSIPPVHNQVPDYLAPGMSPPVPGRG